MKKILRKIIPSKRRLIQLYAALLFNANLKGFTTKNPNSSIYKGPVKNICTPGLNCYSCPGASGACPLGSLQNALYSSGKSAPYYIFGIILLWGILFGRFICGFLCPFGLIQDLLHKIPTPKLKKNRFTKALSYLKYVILVFFVFVIPLAYMLKDFPLPAFCKYICPAGTLGGAIAMLINPANDGLFSRLGPLFTWKFALLVSFIVGCIFIYRLFCRFICPLGALYGLFNRFAILGIKLDKPSCTECGRCIKKCKMDISRVGDHECINCGECISECPTGAIQWRGGKILLPKDEIAPDASPEEKEIYEKKRKKKSLIVKITAGVLAASLLIGALVYYNFFDKVEDVDETPTILTVPDFAFKGVFNNKDYSIHGIEGAVLVACINPNEDGALEYLKTLDTLAKSVAPDTGLEQWCTPVVLFDGCTTEEMVTFVKSSGISYMTSTLVIAHDEGGAYRSSLSSLGLGTGTYVISKAKLVFDVIPSDTSAEDLKKAAELANTSAVEGISEGNLCPTYSFELLSVSGSGFVDTKELRGKTVVINFWYTDCGPCVEELPEFTEVAAEYKDRDVVVIAVHSSLTASTATPAWFAERQSNDGWILENTVFVKDGAGEEFMHRLGLGDAWPSTLVIDAKGVIYKKVTATMSKAELTAAIEAAIAQGKN